MSSSGYATNMVPASSTASARYNIPTPLNSRTPSISGSAAGAYASSIDTSDSRRVLESGPAHPHLKQGKKGNKNCKEQKARGDQGKVLRNAEDMFACNLGWKPSKPQNKSNGNSSGVDTPKIDLSRILFFLTRMSLEEGLARAIEEDREEEWKAEILHQIHMFLALWQPNSKEYPDRPDPAFDGSWMELPDKRPCVEGKKGDKRCSTHPESGMSHKECRKSRRQAAFEERRAAFKRRIAAGRREQVQAKL